MTVSGFRLFFSFRLSDLFPTEWRYYCSGCRPCLVFLFSPPMLASSNTTTAAQFFEKQEVKDQPGTLACTGGEQQTAAGVVRQRYWASTRFSQHFVLESLVDKSRLTESRCWLPFSAQLPNLVYYGNSCCRHAKHPRRGYGALLASAGADQLRGARFSSCQPP